MTKIMRKPRKPLSAYNLFFQEQREKMLCYEDFRRGGDGYSDMARAIASKWNSLDKSIRNQYTKRAKDQKDKYTKDLLEWKNSKAKKVKRTSSTVSDSSRDSSTSSMSSVSSTPSVASTEASLESEPEDCYSAFRVGIPDDVMSDFDEWANAFTTVDNAVDSPVVPELPLSSPFGTTRQCSPARHVRNEDPSNSSLEKRILETIDDLKASVDDDFVGFMSQIFD